MASASRSINMLEGSLTKNILRFALPLALTGILQQLFNAVDVAVVGRFVGANAMAAVGSNTPVVGLIVNLFVGLSLGSNVVLAQLAGMGEFSSMRKAVDISLLLALGCGLMATLVGELAASSVLSMMNVPPEIFPMAEAYLRIYLAGLPVILLYNFEAAILRSQGDSVTPLIALAASGFANVGLNLFFVLVCSMSADGVALATVISNLISAVILFIALLRTDRPIGIKRHKPEFDPVLFKRILLIGLPAGIQSAMFSIANICVQSSINELGATVMAASAAAFNIEIFLYYVLNAFGQACTTFTGHNKGAGNYSRCRAVFRRCNTISLLFVIVLVAGILLAGRPLLSLFNTEEAVITCGQTRLFYILLLEPVAVLMENISGALRGYGCSTPPALISVFGICCFRILWVYTVFAQNKTYTTLLLCYPLSWAITTVLLGAAYIAYLQKTDIESAMK